MAFHERPGADRGRDPALGWGDVKYLDADGRVAAAGE